MVLAIAFPMLLGQTALAQASDKYDPEITINTFFEIAGPLAPYFSEERIQNNIWAKEYKDVLGINLNFLWYANESVDDSVQKKNVAIASGDIPDLMIVNNEQLVLLEKTNLLNRDLMPLFEQHASEDLKKWAYREGPEAMDSATFDGQLIAIPYIEDSVDLLPVVWVRQDWLDTLGMSVPQTMDELYEVIKAFKEKDPDGNGLDDTIGMMLNNDYLNSPNTSSLMGLFNGFDAFPRAWVDDGKGGLVYGSTQPQVKDALVFMAKLYAEGLIEADFSVRDGQKEAESAASGRGGLQYGAQWNSIWPLQSAIDNNPKAVWTPIALPSATGSPAKAQNKLNISRYFVVNAKFEHPEALFKLLNKYVEKFTTLNKEDYARFLVNDTGSDTFDLHGTMFKMFPPLRNVDAHQNVLKALETGDTSMLSAEDANYYKSTVEYHQEGNLSEAGGAKVFGPGGSQSILAYYFNNDLVMRDKFYGAPTRTMGQRMQLIRDKEMEFFTKVMMGEESVDNFDRFLQDINALGLEKITVEVNEWKNR